MPEKDTGSNISPASAVISSLTNSHTTQSLTEAILSVGRVSMLTSGGGVWLHRGIVLTINRVILSGLDPPLNT